MLFNKIRFAGVVILTLQSPLVFAQYAATIHNNEGGQYYLTYLSETEANQEAFTYNQTKTNQNYNFSLQPEIGPVITTIETSRVSATVKNSAVPYISAQTFARGYTGNNGGSNGTGAGIGGSMLYDVQITATPNTQIPIVMTSYYEMRFKTTPPTYIDTVLLGNSGAGGQVGLFAGFNSQLGSQNLYFESNCQVDNVCSTVFNTSKISEPEKIIHRGIIEFGDETYNGSPIFSTQYYDLASTDVANNSYIEHFVKDNIVTSFLLDVGENGMINGSVNIYAEGYSSASSPFNFAESYAYMDPYFEISPEYLALHPNTILSFTAGVGNDNPLAPVPEPETYAMFITGLSLIGFISRRRINKLA